MKQFDTIVIGAGHNGLVCAAYLAKGGHKVLVLEASSCAGGLGAVREFHPGFKASIAHSTGHFSSRVAKDLGLDTTPASGNDSHMTMPTVGLKPDGEAVIIRKNSVAGVGSKDAEAYARFRKLMERFAQTLEPFWGKTMPRIGSKAMPDLMTFARLGLKLRLLGRDDMGEFLRVAALPVRDLMNEYFEDPVLKAALSWDALAGLRMAPRSPNNAVITLLYRLSGNTRGMHYIPQGGVPGLMVSLEEAAQRLGAQIRYGATVDRIHIDESETGLRANGVELAGGQRIEADRVISATDPQRTFFDLVGVDYLDIGFTNRIRRLRCDGLVGKLHLALSATPNIPGLENTQARIIMAPDMDAYEWAYDDAKYGDIPEHPILEVTVPSLAVESLAPPGQHILSAHVMYVPYALKGGWTDEAREVIHKRSIDVIARHSPGLREKIIASEFLTPADLEREYRVTGGHWHHTEFAMDQMLMMRPTYGAAQYRTPIDGLYLCGAGCHPAGDITGLAGHNAAHEVLR